MMPTDQIACCSARSTRVVGIRLHNEIVYNWDMSELRAYSLVDWDTPNPSLKLEEKWTLLKRWT